MRWVAVLALVVIVLMFFGGWLYFRDSGDTSEVILDKQEVQEDTAEAVERGKDVMEKTAEGMKKLGEEVEQSVSDGEGPEEAEPVETSSGT